MRDPDPPPGKPAHRWLDIRPGERAATALSFGYFALLLAAYYTLRPVRDALAAGVIGAGDLRFGFLMVFGVMLALVPVFGTLAARLPRRRLVPVLYLFFIANVLLFHWLFETWAGERWLAFVFFVWLSVFNLFVVSVFWSFMADIFSEDQAERLFGPIAAGGSVGAITGPLLTRWLVESLGVSRLMFVAAVLLALALGCMLWLARHAPRRDVERAGAMGGGPLEGARLALSRPFLRGVTLFMLLGTFTGSLLYLQQLELGRGVAGRTEGLAAFFAGIDLSVNLLSIGFQLFLTGPLLRRLGFARTLALLPVLVLAGFCALAVWPVLWLVVAMQVLRRATLFAITNPVSQMLFAAVGPRSKYKFKNFLDTAVYRAGDTSGSFAFAGLLALGLPAVSAVGALAALGWTGVAAWVGRRFAAMQESGRAPP